MSLTTIDVSTLKPVGETRRKNVNRDIGRQLSALEINKAILAPWQGESAKQQSSAVLNAISGATNFEFSLIQNATDLKYYIQRTK